MRNDECEEEVKREETNFRNLLICLQILFFLLWCFPNSSDIYQNPWSSSEVFIPTFIIISFCGVKYFCCIFIIKRDYDPPLPIHNNLLRKSLIETTNSIEYTNNYNNDNNDNNNDNSSYDYSYDESVTV